MPRLRRTVEGTSPNTVDNQEQVLRRQEVEAVDTEQPMRPVEVDALQRRRGRPRKSEQPTAGETLQPETPKRKRGRPKKNPLPEPEMEAPEQEEALLEPTVGEQGSVAVEESTVVAEQPSVATEESELPVSEQLSFPVGEPTQEVEAAPEQPPAEELTPEAEGPVSEPEPVAEEQLSTAESPSPEQSEAEEPVAEPEVPVEEPLPAAEELTSEVESPVSEPEPVAEEQLSTAEESAPEAEVALPEQPETGETTAMESEDVVSEETELSESAEVPAEQIPVEGIEAVEPPVEESTIVEEPVSAEESVVAPEEPAGEEPTVAQEAAPVEDQGEVTLKYDMDSGKRYVDEISQKTNFEKMLEELAKISKDMLSWEVEKFTDRFTKKYVGEGMTLEESNSQKFEAFLGGFITNAAMELYDRGYKNAAFHKLEQAISVLEARKKLDYEVDTIKSRQDEDVVDLSDMLGLFDGD
ncbi:MAG: hypothetical protein IJR68_09410 [Fretibacterium sp.]|nr:hypothetical protein [Fretibacterium sp.]